MAAVIFSVVIPVYRNFSSLPFLIEALNELAVTFRTRLAGDMEVIFVVDGSPDASFQWLVSKLPDAPFVSKLIAHSRNFGSFAAIRTGLAEASAKYMGVLSADLQEPPNLMLHFYERLQQSDCDIVVGKRSSRGDSRWSSFASNMFWFVYRKLVQPAIPPGGVDVFGCNQRFRDELLRLGEANTSLVGLVFWLGFLRQEVAYERRARKYGKSAWSFHRKINYLLDSIFAFTDLPIKMVSTIGAIGTVIATTWGTVVLIAKLLFEIEVPGYTATVLAILFFGGLNLFAVGLVGSYAWRAYENTKARPLSLVMDCRVFPGSGTKEVTSSN